MASDTSPETSNEPADDGSLDEPPVSIVDEQPVTDSETTTSTTVEEEDPVDPASEVGESDESEIEPDKEQEMDTDEKSAPEITGPPKRFQSAIQGGTIKTVITTLGAIVDETCIHIDEDGIRIRAVDPANVAMDDLHLDVAFRAVKRDRLASGFERLGLTVVGTRHSDTTTQFVRVLDLVRDHTRFYTC